MPEIRFSKRLDFHPDYIVIGVTYDPDSGLPGQVTVFSSFNTGLPGQMSFELLPDRIRLFTDEKSHGKRVVKDYENVYSTAVGKAISDRLC